MSRLIKHEENTPIKIKVGNDIKWICRCGLSKNQPFCDGSHKYCIEEKANKTYIYKNGERREI